MKSFLFLAFGTSFLFLVACDLPADVPAGTQIGNEGISTLPTDRNCLPDQVLPADARVADWPLTLGQAAGLLLNNVGRVILDDGDQMFLGEVGINVVGYRYDGDCSNVLVELEATFDFGAPLLAIALGDLAVSVGDPSVGAGLWVADDWTGTMVEAPSEGASLLFDATAGVSGFVSELLYQTCDGENNCTEVSIGTIRSVQ